MNRFRALKYSSVFILPIVAFISFNANGFFCWFPLILVFGIIPFLEMFFKPNEENLTATEIEVVKHDRFYDLVIYSVVLIQFTFLILFLVSLTDKNATNLDLLGRTVSMGIMCGVFGINSAHELGHRTKKSEQLMAKALLLTSLYMHFFIEHNRGHHRNVSTDIDPASSKRNQWLYTFWAKSILFSYLSAWKLESSRLKRKGLPTIHWKNEMIIYQLLQICLVTAIYLSFGGFACLAFLLAALFGVLLLETVNYIEHYGLRRDKVNEHRYENVQPHHSWNSNHPLGRLLLFELSRHSDHHYQAHKHYQTLEHYEVSPQMPTGYPGMMVLSTIPPLWFLIMNKHVDRETAKANKLLNKV